MLKTSLVGSLCRGLGLGACVYGPVLLVAVAEAVVPTGPVRWVAWAVPGLLAAFVGAYLLPERPRTHLIAAVGVAAGPLGAVVGQIVFVLVAGAMESVSLLTGMAGRSQVPIAPLAEDLVRVLPLELAFAAGLALLLVAPAYQRSGWAKRAGTVFLGSAGLVLALVVAVSSWRIPGRSDAYTGGLLLMDVPGQALVVGVGLGLISRIRRPLASGGVPGSVNVELRAEDAAWAREVGQPGEDGPA